MSTILQILQSKSDCILGKGASREALHQAESDLQVQFAADYCEYLLNVGLAAYDGHELTGICSSTRLNVVNTTIAEREKHRAIPGDFYVIEKAGIDGIVIWQKSSGEIFETIFDSSPVLICESLGDYIERYAV